MQRHLSTPRLVLRAPEPGDAEFAFARWAADAELLRHMDMAAAPDLAHTRALLQWDSARWLKRSAYTWMVLVQGAAGPVGQVQLLPQRLDGTAHHLRPGYLLARSHHGRGLAREAVAAVLDHAFTQPEVWRVDALCDVANTASQRLLQALGLQCEGRLARHELRRHQGPVPHDMWLYARVREAGDQAC